MLRQKMYKKKMFLLTLCFVFAFSSIPLTTALFAEPAEEVMFGAVDCVFVEDYLD